MMTQEEFFKRYTYSPSRDRIGGGGFGTVYKAKDNVLHRTVAIKVSEVKTTADGQKTFSLKDEFEALNHVPKHPNIANYEEFYSFESPQGIFDYAVMQYYPDGNLSNAIKQGLTAEQKEDIATQLLEGIAFLHEHKVVHRDLKPGNILIVRDGDSIIPLITDFGLSKATNTGDGSVFTNSIGGGTPRYSSPEQLQGKPLRFNTDLWSYGSILYEIFTGEQLFTAGSGAANTAQAGLEIYNKIVNGNVSALGKMPEKWRRVAERCLVVDAEKRAKDASELFRIISGEEQADETEAVGLTFPKTKENSFPSTPDDTQLAESPHRGLDPRSSKLNNATVLKPKSKKPLWIALAAAAVAALVVVLVIRQPKKALVSTNLDTQVNNVVNRMSIVIDPWNWVTCNENDRKNTAKQIVVVSINDQFQYFVDENAADESHLADLIKERINDYNQTVVVLQYDKSVPVQFIVHVIDTLADIAQSSGALYVDFGLPSGRLWTLDPSSKTMIKNTVTIYFDENCQCFVNDTQVLEEYQLKELINTKIGGDPLCAIVIRTDKAVPVQYIVNVIDTVIEINNVTGNNHDVIIAPSPRYDGEQPDRPVGI